jgi:hypothetical protein
MPIENIFEESKRILSVAKERGITLRLLGGMAIRFRCKSAITDSLARKYADIDVEADPGTFHGPWLQL